MFDSSVPLDRFDAHIINRIEQAQAAKIAVINKSDLPCKMDPCQIEGVFDKIVYLSSATGQGREELFSTIESLYTDGEIDYNTTAVVANARQYAALCTADGHIADGCAHCRQGTAPSCAPLK